METDRGQIITYSRISDGTYTDPSFTGNFLLLPSENVYLPFGFVWYHSPLLVIIVPVMNFSF